MMIKSFNIALGVLVAFSVWCAAVLFTIMVMHVLVIGGFTVYRLINP